jgi:HlyD family secretion protein
VKGRALLLWLCVALGGCEPAAKPGPAYGTAIVERRDISVIVSAAGVVEPLTTVEVKSKASGEVLKIHAETGDIVEQYALLVEIDPRTARNRLAQAEAGLKAARAHLTIAKSQMDRASRLLDSGTYTEADHDQAFLVLANSEAEVVTAQVNVENARISLEDASIRAPIGGTIIEKRVETGNVISSPTQDVGGGTLLLKMADLNRVQVRALVDETDIGKVREGVPAKVTVAAFPNQPFPGEVLKIEPQAIEEQNVTMFAVLVTLANRGGLLRPGMNAEVEVSIASRSDVLSLPITAIRTDRDFASTASILALSETTLRQQVDSSEAAVSAGRGGEGTGAGAREGTSETGYEFGGDFWVVLEHDGRYRAVRVRTGITDLDHVEIVDGVEVADSALLLPSTHLYETQEQLQRYATRRAGGVPGISEKRR